MDSNKLKTLFIPIEISGMTVMNNYFNVVIILTYVTSKVSKISPLSFIIYPTWEAIGGSEDIFACDTEMTVPIAGVPTLFIE